MKSLENEIKITFLGKKIKRSGSRRIVRIRIINGMIGRKKIKYV